MRRVRVGQKQNHKKDSARFPNEKRAESCNDGFSGCCGLGRDPRHRLGGFPLEIMNERETTDGGVAPARIAAVLVRFIAQENAKRITGAVSDVNMSTERH